MKPWEVPESPVLKILYLLWVGLDLQPQQIQYLQNRSLFLHTGVVAGHMKKAKIALCFMTAIRIGVYRLQPGATIMIVQVTRIACAMTPSKQNETAGSGEHAGVCDWMTPPETG